MTRTFWACASVLALASPVLAEQTDERRAFVEANILSIFYHELGHAVIDLMQVPIFGQEEDAADTMAVLLIDALFDEDAAQDIAYDSAFGYINDPDGTEEVAYWDLHGPDEQRYYNHVCLFYGANPDDREELVEDLGLPEERAESCPDEFAQAIDSWGAIFDEMADGTPGSGLVLDAKANAEHEAYALLADEIAQLNKDFALPETVTVRIESCGEANAFYDPQEVSITYCTEFSPHLETVFEALN